jgi:hypothetical protein
LHGHPFSAKHILSPAPWREVGGFFGADEIEKVEEPLLQGVGLSKTPVCGNQ